MTEDLKNLISDYQTGLSVLRDLFAQLSDRYKVTDRPPAGFVAEKPLDHKAQAETVRRVGYMLVSVLCANWEGLLSGIQECDSAAHGKLCTGLFGIWCIESMKQIGNIRHCIMHHNGDIRKYYKALVDRYPGHRNPPSMNSWLELGKIDEKYHDPANNKSGPVKVALSEDDVKYFFRVMQEDALDHVQKFLF